MTSKHILAVSGSGIFNGGGLYVDLTTYTTNHLHGFLTVTCLTTLIENGLDISTTDETVFSYQLNSLGDAPLSGIKFGLLPNVEAADSALKFVESHVGIPIISDPVLACKEKRDAEVPTLHDELLKFFSYMTIVTPNSVEAELLTQTSIKTSDDTRAAAKRLYQLGTKNLAVKDGSRLSKEEAIDAFYDGESVTVFETPILENDSISAGCIFASSIASQLMLGKFAKAAVEQSKKFVYQAIRHSD